MRWMSLALLCVPLQACMFYGHRDCDRCSGGGNWNWNNDTGIVDTGGSQNASGQDTSSSNSGTADSGTTHDTSSCDTGTSQARLALGFSPSQADLGSTFIGSLTDSTGADLSKVTSVQFFGPVTVQAMDARPNEVILSLSAAADGQPGPVDLLAQFADGTAGYLPNALTLVTPPVPPTDTGGGCTCP